MSSLIDALTNFGMIVDHVMIDGAVHRLDMAGKRKNNRNGWYVAHQKDDKCYAMFGTWEDRSQDQKWTDNGTTSDESAQFWREAAAARAIIEADEHRKAAATAVSIWNSAEAMTAHPYLAKKGINPHGAKLSKCKIVVPVIDGEGALSSLQFIDADGGKKFLYQGKIQGGCYPIPGDNSRIYICEGYATGATIADLTGHRVLVAFNAGNLMAVAQSARAMYPDGNIIIAADNDHATKAGNVGLEKAKKAAELIRASVVAPECPPGTDFNDMAQLTPDRAKAILIGEDIPRIMYAADCDLARKITLSIPKAVSNPGGLISLGMKALSGHGMPDIPQFNLPVVLTTLANAAAGKIVFGSQWPNVYNIKVGPTSRGKTDSDQAMVAAIEAVMGGEFYGVTDFASGPALLRSLAKNPIQMIVIDEATSLFKRYQTADITSDSKRDALLEVYSKSGGRIKRAYSDARNTIEVDYPCLSLTGNATPVIFDAIKQEDFDTGTMQRFDFWCYDGPMLERESTSEKNVYLEGFAQAVAKIRRSQPPEGNLAGMGQGFGAYQIDATIQARRRLSEWSKEIIERTNNATSDGNGGIISRGYNLAIKYAMVHMVSSRPIETIYQPMEVVDIEYGIAVAKMLSEWKITVLQERITTGDFHQQCEIFKSAIAAATKAGLRPTFRIMANRRSVLKNWKRKDSEEVIKILTKRGEIFVDETRKTSAYFLVKLDEVYL